MLDLLAKFWPWLVALLDVALVTWAVIHIVLTKRDARAAASWTGLVLLAPLIGAVLYGCFGINRIQRKGVAMKLRNSWKPPAEPRLTRRDNERVEEFVALHPSLLGLAAVSRRLTDRQLMPGNRVDALINGDDAFPAMLEAIDAAEHSVALLSYIFDDDAVGERFAAALVAAMRRGVEVRVLIDGVGSRYSRPNMVRRLRSLGVNAAAFLPTRVPRFFKYANLRNHRKILVVDGRIGFVGGTNIRGHHCIAQSPRSPVRCTHFRVTGPVVQQAMEVFAIDWAFATGESLGGETWFPPVERAGKVWARGVAAGPDEDIDKLADLLVAAISAAAEHVRIVTPYFLPEASITKALTIAAMRGVEVTIAIPARGNIPLVDWATMSTVDALVDRGCNVHLTPIPFDHSKLMVVDGVWSLIGSTNWDARSLRLNFEFNLECYDDALATAINAVIDEKLADSRKLTIDDFTRRSLPIRIRDGLARLWAPYL